MIKSVIVVAASSMSSEDLKAHDGVADHTENHPEILATSWSVLDTSDNLEENCTFLILVVLGLFPHGWIHLLQVALDKSVS